MKKNLRRSHKEYQEDLKRGLQIEETVLKTIGPAISGLFVTPIGGTPSNGKGPRVWSKDLGGFDLPAHDMHGDFAGKTFDIQVKGKGYAPWYGLWSTYTHGIDLPIYEQYRKGSDLTGHPLLIIVFEVLQNPEDGPGYVPSGLAQFLHNLPEAQISRPSPSFPNGGAFWPRGAFLPIFNTSLIPPPLIMEDNTPRFQIFLRREFLPPEQTTVTCSRCGRGTMFRPTGNSAWMCMSCDAPERWPSIEQRRFEPLSSIRERLFARFGNQAWIYG